MAMSVAYRSTTFSIFNQGFAAASITDTDWISNSSSRMMKVDDAALKSERTGSDWTREEDKAFENALAAYYNDANMWDKIALAVPGKTIEDLKHHYEALIADVEAIESGKVPLPDYSSEVRIPKDKRSKQVRRGAPWTEEHRQFLYGLQRFGRGDWRSISRYIVRTKSSSQVASHAQKYFKRLNSAKDGKRQTINDIRTVDPEKVIAYDKATTSCMPECLKGKSSNAGTEELLRENLEKAATGVGNQLLPECTTEASIDAENQLLPEYLNEASVNAGKHLLCKRRTKAPTAKNQLVNRYPFEISSIDGNEMLSRHPKRVVTYTKNQVLPGYPNNASTSFGNQMLSGFPEKAPTETGNQLLHGFPKKARCDMDQLLTGHPMKAPTDIGYPKKAPTAASLFGSDASYSWQGVGIDNVKQPMQATTSLGNQVLLGYPMEASISLGERPPHRNPINTPTDAWNRVPPPSPFVGMSDASPYSGPSFSAPTLQIRDISSPPIAFEPVQGAGGPGHSVEMPDHPVPSNKIGEFYSKYAVMEDADVSADVHFDIGSSTEIADLDLSLFPHFLD